MRLSDLPRLRELEGEWRWTFGSDFSGALVVVDDADVAIAVAGAWKVAETHVLMDPAWKSPAMRLVALAQLHEAMRERTAGQGFRRSVTWMVEELRAFARRLQGFGWVRSDVPSYHRRLR